MEIEHYRALRDQAATERRENHYMTPEKRTERAHAMTKLRYEDKLTLQAIGTRYGLTRERVRQIIDGYLSTPKN
jgi:DNA-directed RNA polymerase sigma subunit (sigma70/sigma32)